LLEEIMTLKLVLFEEIINIIVGGGNNPESSVSGDNK
jgi:hypothetical protein